MKSLLLKIRLPVGLALLPCSCTTVVETPKEPETTTTVHRETRTSTVIPVDPMAVPTRSQTTTTTTLRE